MNDDCAFRTTKILFYPKIYEICLFCLKIKIEFSEGGESITSGKSYFWFRTAFVLKQKFPRRLIFYLSKGFCADNCILLQSNSLFFSWFARKFLNYINLVDKTVMPQIKWPSQMTKELKKLLITADTLRTNKMILKIETRRLLSAVLEELWKRL